MKKLLLTTAVVLAGIGGFIAYASTDHLERSVEGLVTEHPEWLPVAEAKAYVPLTAVLSGYNHIPVSIVTKKGNHAVVFVNVTGNVVSSSTWMQVEQSWALAGLMMREGVDNRTSSASPPGPAN
jgi:hypothetical protein